jgi:hypothetical protein
MKRMNEVFELPVSDMDVAYLTGQNEDGSMTFMENVRCKHAAHAINHVDALADALEALLVESQCHAGSLGFYQAQDDAKAALKAYRGEK